MFRWVRRTCWLCWIGRDHGERSRDVQDSSHDWFDSDLGAGDDRHRDAGGIPDGCASSRPGEHPGRRGRLRQLLLRADEHGIHDGAGGAAEPADDHRCARCATFEADLAALAAQGRHTVSGPVQLRGSNPSKEAHRADQTVVDVLFKMLPVKIVDAGGAAVGTVPDTRGSMSSRWCAMGRSGGSTASSCSNSH